MLFLFTFYEVNYGGSNFEGIFRVMEVAVSFNACSFPLGYLKILKVAVVASLAVFGRLRKYQNYCDVSRFGLSRSHNLLMNLSYV